MKRNDMNDFDFIKDKFEKTYPTTPEGLSEDAINQLLLSKQEPKIIKLKPRYNVRAIVSAVAGLILVLGIVYAAYISGIFPGNNNKVGTFENYNEVNITGTFSDNDESKGISDDYSSVFAAIDSIIGRVGWYPPEGMGGDSFDPQIIDKYENVQEPDQIKTDGEYFYCLYNHTLYNDFGSEEENRIYIYKAENGRSELVTVINYNAEANGAEYSDSFSVSMRDLYVYGDRLIVELEIDDWAAESEYRRDFKKTVTQIYDISDRSAPKLISEFEQSGDKVSSQMIDNYLYTVSYYYAPEEKGKYTIPVSGRVNDADYISAENISIFENSDDLRFLVVSAIDVEEAEKVSDSKAVLGAVDNVFFNGEDLYIMGTPFGLTDNASDLDIIKAELRDGNIAFTKETRINGGFDYNVNIVENNGSVIVLDYNNLKFYALNGELEAKGEKRFENCDGITAVRFVGDMLYIVTYSNEYLTGRSEYELRVFDLSDHQNLREKSSLTLSKSVQQIIPVDDNTIICLGEGGSYDSDAITLIDVSDKSEPAMLDCKEFYDDLRLNAYDDYIVNAEKDYLTISCRDQSGEKTQYGVITVIIDDGKIVITNQVVSEIFSNYGRWLCAGDYLYGFDVNYSAPVDEAIIILAHKCE